MVNLPDLLLSPNLTDQQLEAETRRIYFGELVPNPPVLPKISGMDHWSIEVTNSEGAFKHLFGESEGWTCYRHAKTGRLDRERMLRIKWIRAVLELQAKGTRIYVNNHSMGMREHGPRAPVEKKRFYIVTQTGILYFVGLKYLPNSLVLTTAFTPDGRWARETVKRHGTTLLWPAQ